MVQFSRDGVYVECLETNATKLTTTPLRRSSISRKRKTVLNKWLKKFGNGYIEARHLPWGMETHRLQRFMVPQESLPQT